VKVDFVPVRWWQAIDFIHLNLEMVRGRDPWADRILAHPWAPSSLLEYAYFLAEFPSSDVYFIVVSGERVGALWMTRRSKLTYMRSLGLLSDFRTGDVGMLVARLLIRTIRFVEDYFDHRNCEILVLRIHASNMPSQRLAELFHCRPLGLATARLTLLATDWPVFAGIEIRKVRKPGAVTAWRRWRLHVVEHVAGRAGAEVAAEFWKAFRWVDALPRGRHLSLYQGDQEIGFAFAHQRGGEMEIGLFPAVEFFSGSQTARLVSALVTYLKTPVRHLTLAQKHADALAESAPFGHERNREEERLTLFRFRWLESGTAAPPSDAPETARKEVA
jgi:hypothetical protein